MKYLEHINVTMFQKGYKVIQIFKIFSTASITVQYYYLYKEITEIQNFQLTHFTEYIFFVRLISASIVKLSVPTNVE